MKKLLAITLVIIMTLSLCACGNMSMGLGTYDFTHIHFSDSLEGHCVDISKWYDDSTGVEILTVDGGSIFLSEGTYIMFSDSDCCPFCD